MICPLKVVRLYGEFLRALHLSCRRCPLRAVVLVNSAPQLGQDDFVAWPDFSLWCLSRLLNVENCLPLHPCSQHCGLGRVWTTRTWPGSGTVLPIAEGSGPLAGSMGE